MRVNISSAIESLNTCDAQLAPRYNSLNSKNISEKVIVDVVRALDGFIVFLCAIIAKLIYIDLFGGNMTIESSYILVGFCGALASLIALNYTNIYSPQDILRNGLGLRHMGTIFKSLSYSFMMLVSVGFAFKLAELYSRGWYFTWFILSFIAISLVRIGAFYILRKLAKKGHFRTRIALYGVSPQNLTLRENIHNGSLQFASLNGLYENNKKAIDDCGENLIISGDLDDLILDGMKNKFDRIIIGLPNSRIAEIADLTAALSVLPIDIQICPETMPLASLKPHVSYFAGQTLFDVSPKPISEWQEIAKDMMDKILGLTLLLVASPFMAIIAIAIRLDSPGPVFFLQKRHGYNHQTIKVVKFRTMTVMQDGDEIKQAVKNDQRVTRVGAFLRKTSLDELPQLLNVLNADMSLVGPRPHALVQNNYYSNVLEKYAKRHKVKPGITGLAQIRGLRGETDTLDKMRERAEADIFYIDNWSFWMDLKILVKTPLSLLRYRDVY